MLKSKILSKISIHVQCVFGFMELYILVNWNNCKYVSKVDVYDAVKSLFLLFSLFFLRKVNPRTLSFAQRKWWRIGGGMIE